MEIYSSKTINAMRHAKIIDTLVIQFADPERQSPLIWNRLSQKPNRVIPEMAKQIVFPKRKVFFYLERSNEIYQTTIDDIHTFIEGLEPWIDIDAYIFDESFAWLVVIPMKIVG